jgi:hypothetical protein
MTSGPSTDPGFLEITKEVWEAAQHHADRGPALLARSHDTASEAQGLREKRVSILPFAPRVPSHPVKRPALRAFPEGPSDR